MKTLVPNLRSIHQRPMQWVRALTALFASALLSVPAWGAMGSDFNADNRGDILWYNTSTGMLYELQMNGFTTGASGVVDTRTDLNWKVVAIADINGDGRADIVWQNNVTGAVQGLLMDGTTVIGSGTIYTEPNTNWKVVGAGDFNGDGKADLLWKNNTTGDVFMQLLNGLTPTGGGVVYSEPNTAWVIQQVADFDGNNRADILWRNTTTGDVFVLLMNGTTVAGGGVIYSEPNTAWKIQAAADFNSDGRADILWRNTTTGDVFMMLMNGTTIAGGSVFYGEPNAAWKISVAADYNGDGRADILWRNTSTGQVYMMIMSGFTIAASNFVYTEPDQNWIILPFSSPTAPPPPESPQKIAARLLAQTTFGATRTEIDRVAAMTPDAYLTEQFGIAATSHLTTVRNDPNYPLQPWAVMPPSIWKQYFESNDQLRQRVVFALSQILVISQQNNTLLDQSCGPAYYLDMLGTHAFGNFRNMLKDMTLSPAMGEYLDMKGSAKADPILNIIPNENFARELLQLFSIGTVMLNIDGSVQLVDGKPVDTYTEATAQEVARALTGWTFAGQDQTKTWRWLYPDVPYPSDAATAAKACTAWSSPMAPWTANYRSSDDTRNITGPAHDMGPKTLLSYPGADSHKRVIPAGQTPAQDLDDVIENVFNHPNVGPFIGKQLIQRLVTSNPTPAYVTRVANVFNNNGAGVRGDMKAVLRAILLDQEARSPISAQGANFGKLREPVIRFTHMHRAFNARMTAGYASIWDLGGSDALGQSPLRAPSVFNFYPPDFSPTGPLSQAVPSLVGPEFGITNSATISGFMDFSKWGIIGGFGQSESDQGKWLRPDYSFYTGLAGNPTQLVDALDIVLLSGSMSTQFRTRLIDVATKLTDSNATTQANERVKTLLWLILNSPEYSIQK
jgi:uncharacterized protein (DUF1800 family)